LKVKHLKRYNCRDVMRLSGYAIHHFTRYTLLSQTI
jgi:hypothetical protein